jgi:hypothetical protein
MDAVLLWIESFILKLPPLLQLLAGVFASLAAFKLLVLIVDYFDKGDDKK